MTGGPVFDPVPESFVASLTFTDTGVGPGRADEGCGRAVAPRAAVAGDLESAEGLGDTAPEDAPATTLEPVTPGRAGPPNLHVGSEDAGTVTTPRVVR
jgi:hypothetical protein